MVTRNRRALSLFVVRLAGAVVIVATMTIGPMVAPRLFPIPFHVAGLQPRAQEKTAGSAAFPIGFAEQFEPYSGEVPDERWAGCWLTDVNAAPLASTFVFRCADNTSAVVKVDITAVARPGHYTFSSTGTAPATLRDELVQRVQTTIGTIFDGSATAIGGMPKRGLTRPAHQELQAWGLGVHLLSTLLFVFMWLFLTGFFGFCGLRRSDWAITAPVLAGLFMRLVLARHANSEITVYFHVQSLDALYTDKHSVVYALVKMLLAALMGTSHEVLFVFNAVVGALAAIPLYVYVSRRFDHRVAALFAAALYAVHPLIVRIGPTDAHYPLLVFFWMWGLAFLSGRDLGASQVFAGFVFLGLAASMRIEGPVYAAVAMLMLPPAFPATIRRSWAAALAGLAVIAGLVAMTLTYKIGLWGGELGLWGWRHSWLGGISSSHVVRAVVALVGHTWWSDVVFLGLAWIGAAAGVIDRRRRGALGILALSLVLACLGSAADQNAVVAHLLVPPYVLLAIVGGFGAAWLSELVPAGNARSGAAAALSLVIMVVVPLSHLDRLREEYTFNTEYAMLRRHLAVDSNPIKKCSLLFFSGAGDTELRNPQLIVPEARIVDCMWHDCQQVARGGGCVYYLKGSSCAATFPLQRDEIPSTMPGALPTGSVSMRDVCATFERGVVLKPLEERHVDFFKTFARPGRDMLPAGTIGLYEVVGTR